MKARLLLSIAAVAMLAMACSTKNETVPEKIKGVSFKATVKAPSTKALTDNGTSIGSSWAVDETVALVYSVGGTAYNSTATVEEVNSSGTATMQRRATTVRMAFCLRLLESRQVQMAMSKTAAKA